MVHGRASCVQKISLSVALFDPVVPWEIDVSFHDAPIGIKSRYHLPSSFEPELKNYHRITTPPPHPPSFPRLHLFHHPHPPTTLLFPASPPRQKAQRKRSAKGREREPNECRVRLGLSAPVSQIDARADLAIMVDAAVDDDVVRGVGCGGAGVGA